MQAVLSVVVGLMVSAPVIAESLVEGWVRRSSGEPVKAAQVWVFDWTDLRRGAVAQATTDAAGYFALPLASLGGSVLPQAWTLGQNYPNPFNPSTLIPYQVPTAGRVRLEVFNVLGQRVAALVDEERSAGVHTAVWDATDVVGRPVGAGVYFYRLHSAGQPTLTRRMVLIDGQAGQATASVPLPMRLSSAVAAEGVYGLAVTGAGLVTYVDAAFGVRAGMAPVEVVVEAVERLPRGKALTGGVLGDVNGDGQVTLDDALLLMTYVADIADGVAVVSDIVDGVAVFAVDLSLGDVNGDGQVNVDDALLLMTYVANPADASLPAGIGQAVSGSGGDWVAGDIRRLTDHSADNYSPSWSPNGRHIAFYSYRDGNWDIYVIGSDGTNLRNLTNDSDWDFSPSWSPDGRYIAFSSWRPGVPEIYVMGSDGTNLRNLTNHRDADLEPSWSPDGRHLAFVSDRDGNSDIFSDRDVDEEIYVMDSDGSNIRRLTHNSAWDGEPSWSPDGRHLAFASDRDGNEEIYVMDSDGSNPRRLTHHSAGDLEPSWSPDGRHLAFASERDGDAEIYVMDSDGSNPRRLTHHSAWDDSPSWSPDGRHIAFRSSGDVYVMELRKEGSDGTPLDDGDTPETATPVAVGEPIEGELSAGDIDYFRVTVSNAGTLVASTIGSTNTYGSIEDNLGNVLNGDDDGGEGHNFRVSAAVEPGTYYIRVRGFEPSTTGDYTLFVAILPDLVVQSPSVSDNTLTARQSFTLRATVLNQGGGQSGSTTMRYYLSTNSTISTSDGEVGTDRVSSLSANGVSDESISLNAPTSSGTYYYGACVESVSGESNTDNNCSTGVRVTVGTSISSSACETSLGVVSSIVSRSGTWTSDCRSEHSTSNGFYARYYAFTLSRNSEVTIDLTSSEDSFLILLSDEGKNGTVIETDNDDGNGSNARIRRNLSAGTYTVEATTYWSETTGNFTLRIDVDQGSTSSTTGGAFDIELVFLNDNDFTSSQKALLQQAAAHWMSIITGDIEDVDFSDNPFDEWDSTLNARIRVNDTVDDLWLFVRALAIDGPYNTSGQGGHWMILRGESHLLPKIGTIVIDTADLQRLEEEGALLGTFLHEIGHALGITEIMRQELDLLRGNNDRYFTGPLATQAFNNAGGRNYNGVRVPTERDGSHWRKSVFGDELMSPSSYSSDNRPLSTVTIQSLADIGYRVDVTQADAYRVPEPASAKLVSDHVPVREDCILNGPIYVVEENGRIIRVIGE